MLAKFSKYINNNNLYTKDDKILLAISGGTDSVALLHLFHLAGFDIGLAHCNFTLRGSESDSDEQFVKELATKYDIKAHFISFNTKQFAKESKLSIEMAARELRYNWFNELCNEFNYSKIATGHHANDSIETLLINLTRGTGINGITGIKPQNGNIIRPLLFATRVQIETYIKEEKLEFRTDSSNNSNEFIRNFFRNDIIPKLKEINPSFESTMIQNIENFNNTASIYNKEIENFKFQICRERKQVSKNKNQKLYIIIQKLLKLEHKSTVLYEILSDYGFTFDSTRKILKCTNGESGKVFYSQTHKLLIDREEIIVEKKSDQEVSLLVSSIDNFNILPIDLKVDQMKIEDFKLIKDNLVACIDSEKINYPLTLRKWKEGDFFYPLGMKNRKKLSDFFIDQKIDRFTKESTWILESDYQIVWIVGLRLDDRFKVTKNTKQVIKLTLNH